MNWSRLKLIFLILLFFSVVSMPLSPTVNVYGSPDELTKNPTANDPVGAGWTNPLNAYTSNNVYATSGFPPCIHRFYNYSFSLSGSTITKVEVGIEFYCLPLESVQIRLSWNGGSSYTAWSNRFTLTSEDIIWLDFTSATDWTADKLSDANFRVEIQFLGEGGTGCYGLDGEVGIWNDGRKKIRDVEVGDVLIG